MMTDQELEHLEYVARGLIIYIQARKEAERSPDYRVKEAVADRGCKLKTEMEKVCAFLERDGNCTDNPT